MGCGSRSSWAGGARALQLVHGELVGPERAAGVAGAAGERVRAADVRFMPWALTGYGRAAAGVLCNWRRLWICSRHS